MDAGANEKPIWDQRLPGEPGDAFERFQIYLALGPERSFADAARAYLTPGKTRKPKSGKIRKKQVRLQEKYAQRLDHWPPNALGRRSGHGLWLRGHVLELRGGS